MVKNNNTSLQTFKHDKKTLKLFYFIVDTDYSMNT